MLDKIYSNSLRYFAHSSFVPLDNCMYFSCSLQKKILIPLIFEIVFFYIKHFCNIYGKNACDGIGGTLKRCVTKASLQRLYTDQILTPLDFFNYCKDKITNVKCFFVKKEVVDGVAVSLESRFQNAIPIPGTQKRHRFVPVKDGYLEISKAFEEHAAKKEVKITNQELETATSSASEESKNLVQSYVVIEEGSKKWVGYIDHQDEEFGD